MPLLSGYPTRARQKFAPFLSGIWQGILLRGAIFVRTPGRPPLGYSGPLGSGKRINLEYIRRHIHQGSKGQWLYMGKKSIKKSQPEIFGPGEPTKDAPFVPQGLVTYIAANSGLVVLVHPCCHNCTLAFCVAVHGPCLRCSYSLNSRW
jgi:hypothetical protein